MQNLFKGVGCIVNEIGIKHLSYCLGDSHLIEDIEQLGSTNLADEQFRRIQGIQYYMKTEKSLFEIAVESARKTLSNVDNDRISAVFFATVSYYSKEISDQDFGSRLMCELGLNNAFFFGVFMQNCATVSGAIRMAKNYLISEQVTDVLVISADKIYDDYGISRIGPAYIRSDAALSCIVSREKTEFKILRFSEYQDATLWDCLASDRPRLLKSFKVNTRNVINDSLSINELSRDQIDFVLCNNHDAIIWKHMAEFWEIPYNRFYTKNVYRTSHCPAGDIFINLIDMEKEGVVRDGANILAFFSGPHSWVATVFKKC